MKATETGGYLNTGGGRIYYETRGAGPDLLLIHGYPFNSADWQRVVPALARDHRVILFDLPGLGYSDKPDADVYSFAAYARVVADLTAHLEIEAVDVLAHDLGVSVVQELLARAQEGVREFSGAILRLRSVAFVNGGLFSDVYRPRWIQRLLSQSPDWFGAWLSRRIRRETVERNVRSLFGPNTQPDPKYLAEGWRILTHNDGRRVAYRIGRLIFEKRRHQSRWIHAMRSTETPLAYICGPADPNSGRHMARRFREVLPDAPLYLLGEKIGHWPMLEAPSEFLAAYGRFRKTTGTGDCEAERY